MGFCFPITALNGSPILTKAAVSGGCRKMLDSKDLRFGSPIIDDIIANVGGVFAFETVRSGPQSVMT